MSGVARWCRPAVGLLLAVLACDAFAATAEPPPEPPVDATPCMAAIAAHDDDKVTALCAAVIDDKRTLLPDRMKALVARAGALTRQGQADRAIADYDTALRLDPMQADLFTARGELWRQKGDRPRAIRDFTVALRLDPQNATARSNHKALAYEIEKLGADMAVKNTGKAAPAQPLK